VGTVSSDPLKALVLEKNAKGFWLYPWHYSKLIRLRLL
jgi:hypothetical protein